MGCEGKRATFPSLSKGSLQSNMAKPRQVQSCAYVGTRLAGQRLGVRGKKWFFWVPLKHTFLQWDFRGSRIPRFSPSPSSLHLPGEVPARSRDHMRGPEAKTNLLWPFGGVAFLLGVPISGPDSLPGRSASSRGGFAKDRSRGGWEEEAATCRNTRAGCSPTPAQDSLASPRFSSPLSLPSLSGEEQK